MNYWLLKSEPDSYSYRDLKNEADSSVLWDGVRNYQARNILRDQIQCGDLAFFYHSSCKYPAIVGICRIVATGIPDPTAFDPDSDYFDPKSSQEDPRWITVRVQALEALAKPVLLKDMKLDPELQEMVLLNRSRLSVQPVSERHWQHILNLAGHKANS